MPVLSQLPHDSYEGKSLIPIAPSEMAQYLPCWSDLTARAHLPAVSRAYRLQHSPPKHGGEKTPADSFLQLVLPFSTEPLLRDAYRRLETNEIRVGRVGCLDGLQAWLLNLVSCLLGAAA